MIQEFLRVYVIRCSTDHQADGEGRLFALTKERRFKNTYELLNLRFRNCSPMNKIYIFQCMGKLCCVKV